MGQIRRNLLLTLALFGIAATLVAGVATTRATVSASTTNDGNLWQAGTIDIGVSGPKRFFVSTDRVYPGIARERCLDVRYDGSVADVDLRLFGEVTGGTGLEQYLTLTVDIGTGLDESCGDFADSETLFDGTLADFWVAHPDFAGGMALLTSAQPGQSVTLRLRLDVVDDNAAQGLTSNFDATIEVRP